MKTFLFLVLMTLTAVALPLLGSARAENFTCTCQAASCGNGVTGGTQGKVYRDVPALSAERMFGPSRTGAEKTGWVCGAASAAGAAPAARAAQDTYTCTCTQQHCGGSGTMTGTHGERQEHLAKGIVSTAFRPYLTGAAATGWSCTSGSGEPFPAPSAPPPATLGHASTGEPSAAVDPRQRYTCSCLFATCGGEGGFAAAERGQQHTGISLARLGPKYGPARTGAEATGWACKAEAAPPKYVCTCSRDACGGPDNILEGERGQRHTGVAASHLTASYAPERTGAEATGWTCAEERPPAPPAPRPVVAAVPAAAPVGAVAYAADPGYMCRCEGHGVCGFNGAPYAKRGEVRDGVPAAHINVLYHSDEPNGWVCSRPAGAVLAPAADPGYVCRCQGNYCGAHNAPYAKQGEIRYGVPAAHINDLYHSDQPGGWVCSTK
jgi:hypothetical protein